MICLKSVNMRHVSKCAVFQSVMLAASGALPAEIFIFCCISRLLIFSTANSLHDDKSTGVQFSGCA